MRAKARLREGNWDAAQGNWQVSVPALQLVASCTLWFSIRVCFKKWKDKDGRHPGAPMWTSSVVLDAQETLRHLGRAGGAQQVTRRHAPLEWQLGARQDADFSAILVSKMTVSAHVWALNHSDRSSSFQPGTSVVVCCVFCFVSL